MMAHINTIGVHIPLWMASPLTAIGWGKDAHYPSREGTFFGNLFAPNKNGKLDALYCNGPDFDKNTVPGRLGVNQGAVPYANAYPASAGMDGLCASAGHCVMQADGDGAVSCVGNGVTWKSPITVWRAQTFQAENAILGNGATIFYSATNSNGQRVGNLGPAASVTFNSVKAAVAGNNDLIIYYANGDCSPLPRYFDISVNGGPPQRKSFPVVAYSDWNQVGQVKITLGGFVVGTNKVTFTGSSVITGGPDLDWIEVIGASASTSTTTVGSCNRIDWVESSSSSQPDVTPGVGADGDLTTRWTSGRFQDGKDWYVVDFAGLVNLTSITLNNTKTAGSDYPAGVALYGSTDGTTFDSAPFATANGSANTVVSFPKRKLRALKIKQTGTANATHWWSIGEFQAACSL
jgi:hypothetical protein